MKQENTALFDQFRAFTNHELELLMPDTCEYSQDYETPDLLASGILESSGRESAFCRETISDRYEIFEVCGDPIHNVRLAQFLDSDIYQFNLQKALPAFFFPPSGEPGLC